MGLRNDLFLEDHGRLYHEELLALVSRPSVAVRGAPSRLNIAYGALKDFSLVLLLLVFLLAVGGLEVKAGLAFDDEARSEGQFTGGGFVALVPLIPTAVLDRKRQSRRHEATTLPDEVIDLLVDLLVSLQQLAHQFLSVPLLLHLIVHVVLQKLLFIEL